VTEDAGRPEHDPLSDGAADLEQGLKRAKRVLDAMSLTYTTADLIEAAKVILDAYPRHDWPAELQCVARALESISECLNDSTPKLVHRYSNDAKRAVQVISINGG
jgi:hypothetical protein